MIDLEQFRNSEFATIREHATVDLEIMESVLPMERKAQEIRKTIEETEHQKTKNEKADRIMSYADQWDAKERIDYQEDEYKLHRNRVTFLSLILSADQMEEFAEEIEASL